MTANPVSHIDARFGGEAIRFALPRDEIPFLEHSLQGPAYECFNRFVAGKWTVRDIQLVLSASVPKSVSGVDPKGPEALLQRQNKQLGASVGFAPHVIDSPFVHCVLKDNPPARYAVLAMKVLEAALFGIAERQAEFDENATEEPA